MNPVPSFSVRRHGPGHWDIHAKDRRAFRIRGEDGDVWAFDERGGIHDQPARFKTVNAAVAWCADQLMAEPRPSQETVEALIDALDAMNDRAKAELWTHQLNGPAQEVIAADAALALARGDDA